MILVAFSNLNNSIILFVTHSLSAKNPPGFYWDEIHFKIKIHFKSHLHFIGIFAQVSLTQGVQSHSCIIRC